MTGVKGRGYFVLADISGFTSYLAATELEHAHEILSDLMDRIVGTLTPALMLSKLEGDAVFTYAPQSRLPRGETLLELIEATYRAFRDRLASIRRGTTCECNACRAIPTLDLKFVCHVGEYVTQRVAGGAELLGSDINLVHRLLKNSVAEVTGWRAYALFTERCLEAMGVRPEGLHEQTETYEHLGEVKTYSLDLQRSYEALTATRRVLLTADDADYVAAVRLPAAPAVVWEWLNDPQRSLAWRDVKISTVALSGGRSGVGMRNHCEHGKGSTMQTVLDWRPFDYFSIDYDGVTLETFQLAPADGGTHVEWRLRMQRPLPRWLRRVVMTLAMDGMMKAKRKLARLQALLAAGASVGPADEATPSSTAPAPATP